ncbi:MAG: DNA polymerase III subunit beta [Bacillota bacterium]|nr:DNA polymerase III subunit beta [Bacillota bacterium]
MKFRCNQQMLSKALNTVSKAVSNRTTLPVLKGILIKAENESLLLTASDLDISISRQIDAEIEEEGAVVVMARLFGDIIRKLPNEEIIIEQEEDSVKISTISSEFKVVSLPPEDFPETGKREENDHTISIDQEILRNMIRKTGFAASIEESKGILTGILTEIKKDEITMVALDGFRLALTNEPMKSEKEEKFIISAKIMNEIGRIIWEEDEEDDLLIHLGKKRAVVQTGRTEVVMRIMEGEFIRYQDIIPTDSTTRVIVGRELFQGSMERASLLSREGKNNLVKLSIQGDLLTITSRSEEGNVREEIVIDKEGEDLEIGFNSKYIVDVLKEIDEEKISLHLKTSVTPCVVRPTEGNRYEYLILPVRIPTM